MIKIEDKGSNTLYIETSGINGVGFVLFKDEAKSILQATKKENFLDDGVFFHVEDKIIRFFFGTTHRIVVDLDKKEFLEELQKIISTKD